MSDKVDFKTSYQTKNICHDHRTNPSNNRASKYMSQKPTELKGEIEIQQKQLQISVLTFSNEQNNQKMNKEIEA